MFYKVIGMLVWNGVKFSLRRKYGPALAPKPVLAAGVVAIVAGVAVLASRRESSA